MDAGKGQKETGESIVSQPEFVHPVPGSAGPPREWLDAMRIIWDEAVELLDYRSVYRYIRELIRWNLRLPDDSLVYNWINASYYATSMAVRRLVDPSKGTISLRHLLKWISRRPTGITRAWFVEASDPRSREVLPGQDRSSADLYFDELTGACGPHASAAVVKADLDKLCQAGETIQRYTHEYLAHRSARPTTWLVTYTDLNAAIEAIAQIADRYARLLKVGVVAEPPVPEELKTVFQVPWDPEAARAMKE